MLAQRFDDDTAARSAGGGIYEVRIDAGWWVAAGPNGGYVAALVLRALTAAVGDASRAPRSLTLHYTHPPAAGPARVETHVERRGGALTTVSGRLVQNGRLLALALAAFSKPRRGGRDFDAARMPEVAPPEECPAMQPRIPIHERYEQRWAIGPEPFSDGDRALGGGWIRLPGGRPVDALGLAAFADAFPPAIFATLADRAQTRGVPTVDLSVHFRAALPLPGAADAAWTLAVFRSQVVREGFVEEDGELWSRDGVLLAQSRQLAIAR